LLDSLNGLAETYDVSVIVSTHPRTRKRLDALSGIELDSRVQFMKPFGFCDYIRLQMDSLCVISDSGTVTEEASLLNLPAVTIRNAHERPEGMDAGTLIMAGIKKETVLDSVRVIVSQHVRHKHVVRSVSDYENHSVSTQILRVVHSYVNYINRVVWSKFS
jgi:UDP-N-acetylglucosamine 2-epimerase (non-hydrolysing)